MAPTRLLVSLLAFVFTGCTLKTSSLPDPSPVPSTPTVLDSVTARADPSYLYKLAQVESVSAALLAGETRRVQVKLSGLLHDGATSVHQVVVQRVPGGVHLSVVTKRPRDSMATLALIPFDRVVEVDVSTMAPGPCQITAHGMTTQLDLP